MERHQVVLNTLRWHDQKEKMKAFLPSGQRAAWIRDLIDEALAKLDKEATE